MSNILFVTWDGGGNVPPALGIAAELASRSHGVRFLGHSGQYESITRAGFAFTPTRKRCRSPVSTRTALRR